MAILLAFLTLYTTQPIKLTYFQIKANQLHIKTDMKKKIFMLKEIIPTRDKVFNFHIILLG